MKYLIIFNENEVVHIAPAGGEILTTQTSIICTLEQADTMLTALGVDTEKIENYKEEEI